MKSHFDESLPIDERVSLLLAEMSIEEKVSQLTNSAAGIGRLGIDKYDWWNEALHGVARAGFATVFPQAIGLAATFDEALIYNVADAISTEARAKYNEAKKEGNFSRYYGLTFWSPNINIFRDPRWGRGQETYGEDPFLTSRLGVMFIRGMQGEGIRLKTAACAKHFAAHSGPESIRFGFNAEPSKKDLYETYLPAFEAAVTEGGVEAVMGAYNALDGVPCCCNEKLLTALLRDTWGFKGHVVSDCGAIANICSAHKFAPDLKTAAAKAVKAGCDLNCGTAYEALIDAYESDRITEAEIDKALSHIMKTRIKLGMFDKKTEYDSIRIEAVASNKHKELCLEAARESLVLLKNNGVLPLFEKTAGKIAVIGPNADSTDVLLGNYNGLPTEYHTVFGELKKRHGENNVVYAKGCSLFSKEYDESALNAVAAAKRADVTIMCLGLDATLEGEGGDPADFCAGDRNSLELPDNQKRLLRDISLVAKKLIVITFTGGCVNIGDCADAHIHAWYPGEMGGTALTELIFGDFSPSGKTPVTFYKSTDDLPDFCDYSMKNRTYRYFDGEVLYPFGFGLTYTKLRYSEPFITETEDGVAVSVRIRNFGSRATKEVAELFRSEKDCACNQPRKTLCAFKRVIIDEGEEKTVTFTLGNDELFRINDNGEKEYLPYDKFTYSFSAK